MRLKIKGFSGQIRSFVCYQNNSAIPKTGMTIWKSLITSSSAQALVEV